ncbi:NAC family transcription factor [Methanocalculus sp.]|uniref:NAC family transcription factor n=1 Tax=Methanocalculus sp. TaxID=2004547 RepID=UPI00262A5ED1|nr:NAC family transcription factor [Methanocalculus sp.]MDG6251492.1 NAC family transcription factor [Methanocalculus sp.]
MADEGDYCTVCGGTPPDKILIKQIMVDGKETGIDKLDWIIEEVKKLKLTSKQAIADEIMLRVAQFNYIPTKKREAYQEALLAEYHRSA